MGFLEFLRGVILKDKSLQAFVNKKVFLIDNVRRHAYLLRITTI